jgi:hypothetical protein
MLTNNTKRKPEEVDAANPRPENKFGHIVELRAPDADHTATEFAWDVLVKCGDPSVAEVGATFSPETTENGWFGMPDNCVIDAEDRLWISTDGNSGKETGRSDGLWGLTTEGDGRATSVHFFRCPVGAEMCGPFFTPDTQSLFVAVQHPAEGGEDWPEFGRASTFDDPATRWPDFQDGMRRAQPGGITKQGGGKIADLRPVLVGGAVRSRPPRLSFGGLVGTDAARVGATCLTGGDPMPGTKIEPCGGHRSCRMPVIRELQWRPWTATTTCFSPEPKRKAPDAAPEDTAAPALRPCRLSPATPPRTSRCWRPRARPRRPGMYIGGTDEKAMHHLFAEVIDNSMDEAVRATPAGSMSSSGCLRHANGDRQRLGHPVDPAPKIRDRPRWSHLDPPCPPAASSTPGLRTIRWSSWRRRLRCERSIRHADSSSSA